MKPLIMHYPKGANTLSCRKAAPHLAAITRKGSYSQLWSRVTDNSLSSLLATVRSFEGYRQARKGAMVMVRII